MRWLRQPLVDHRYTIIATRLEIVDAGSPARSPRASALSFGNYHPQSRIILSLPSGYAMESPANVLREAVANDLFVIPGARCLRDWQPQQAHHGAQFLLCDVRQYPTLVAPEGATVWACHLANSAAFARALQSGYGGACGWFFLRDTPADLRRLWPGELRVIQLMSMTAQEVDMTLLDQALRQDMTLAYRLLHYVNAMGFNLSSEISSFAHAMTKLGHRHLYRWLALLLLSTSGAPAAPALLHSAVVRGRLMEQLGVPLLGEEHADTLFICGALSLLPQLLGDHAATLLPSLYLPPLVRGTLESLWRGEVGSDLDYSLLLQLVLSQEKGVVPPTDLVDPQTVWRNTLQAIDYSANLLRAN